VLTVWHACHLPLCWRPLRRTSFAGSLTDLAVLQRGANTRAGIYGIVVGPSTSAKTTVTLQMADLDAKGGVGSTVDVPVTIMSLFAGAQCSLLALSPLSSLLSSFTWFSYFLLLSFLLTSCVSLHCDSSSLLSHLFCLPSRGFLTFSSSRFCSCVSLHCDSSSLLSCLTFLLSRIPSLITLAFFFLFSSHFPGFHSLASHHSNLCFLVS
jgi:hypothetical protein